MTQLVENKVTSYEKQSVNSVGFIGIVRHKYTVSALLR